MSTWQDADSNLDSVKYWIHQLNLLRPTLPLGLSAQSEKINKRNNKAFLLLFGFVSRKHLEVSSSFFLFYRKTHGIYSINSFPVTHPTPNNKIQREQERSKWPDVDDFLLYQNWRSVLLSLCSGSLNLSSGH